MHFRLVLRPRGPRRSDGTQLGGAPEVVRPVAGTKAAAARRARTRASARALGTRPRSHRSDRGPDACSRTAQLDAKRPHRWHEHAPSASILTVPVAMLVGTDDVAARFAASHGRRTGGPAGRARPGGRTGAGHPAARRHGPPRLAGPRLGAGMGRWALTGTARPSAGPGEPPPGLRCQPGVDPRRAAAARGAGRRPSTVGTRCRKPHGRAFGETERRTP